MPYCASCGWQYTGQPRFCRDCGRPILRRAAAAAGRASHAPADLRLVDPAEARRLERRAAWRRRGLIAGLALAAGLAFMLSGAAISGTSLGALPSDEAWVRLVYARNFAQTAHLEFNSGQREPGVGSALWVLAVAFLIKTLAAIGLNVIALVKGASLLAAIASAVLAGELTQRLTGSRAAALAAGGLVALDPTFAFAGSGGVEATLLAALALATCLALVEARPLATGLLLALAVLTSLEGLVLIPFVAAAVLWPWTDQLRRRRRPDLYELRDAAMVIVPTLVALLLWVWLDAPPGGRLPSEIYVARAIKPGLPLPDLAGLWSGYFGPSAGYFTAGAWVVALPGIALGGWWLVRERGWRAAPVVAFPPLVALGLAAFLPLPREVWSFSMRRHLDPVLPFIAVLLVLGLRAAFLHGRAWVERAVPATSSRRPGLAIAAAAVPLLMAAMPLAGLASLWERMPREYAGATAGASDTWFALALFVRDRVPEEALIASPEPGALRYVSRRPVADLSGSHTPVLAGREPLEALVEARAELAALPRTRLWDSAPGASLVQEFAGPTGGAGPRVGLFKLAPGANTSARDGVYAFPTDRLRRLDYVDVGAEGSEREHNYQAAEAGEVIRRTMRVSEERSVADDGRTWRGSEAVTLLAEPGKDLVVARRFDGFAAGGFLVTIDGQTIGEWWPRAGAYGLAEDTFRVPGRLVRVPRAVIRLELIAGSAREVASFGYWSFVDRS